jgi:dihydroorotate dehydrogenase electron transfer subunit
MLAEAREGDEIPVVCPLGRPWPELPPGRSAVALAGGVAIASVYPLLAAHPGRISLVYGARTKAEFVLLKELGGLTRELHLATDDGTRGARGSVLDVWEALAPDPGSVLYVCGPRGMIRAAALAARARGVTEAYASLEEYMACGVGACVGCVVRTVRGYERVCKEGPVFPLGEIDWAGGAG